MSVAASGGDGTGQVAPVAFGARVALAYSSIFLFVGLYLPFFPLWLEAKGLSAVEISIVLSLPMLLRVFFSLPVTARADRASERANIVILLYCLSAVAAVGYLFVAEFWTILAVTVAYSLFNNPIVPILDSLTLSGVRRFGADYGRIRLWGSIVFIVANLGGGVLLAGYDVETLLRVLIATVCLGALLSPLLPRIGPPRRRRGALTLGSASTWRLFADRRFLFVVLASGVIQASHALIYGFGSIQWQSAGFTGTEIGALWATGVIAEVVLFRFSRNVLRRTGAIELLVIGCIGSMLRWVLMLAQPPLAGAFALQALHGISFGATHLGTMHFLAETVDEERMGAAQGAVVVVGGLTMAVAVFVSGPLYARFGIPAYLFMAGAAAGGLALALLARRQPQNRALGGETSEVE